MTAYKPHLWPGEGPVQRSVLAHVLGPQSIGGLHKHSPFLNAVGERQDLLFIAQKLADIKAIYSVLWQLTIMYKRLLWFLTSR